MWTVIGVFLSFHLAGIMVVVHSKDCPCFDGNMVNQRQGSRKLSLMYEDRVGCAVHFKAMYIHCAWHCHLVFHCEIFSTDFAADGYCITQWASGDGR